MVATDGHRMAHIESTKFKAPVEAATRVLIPRKALMELGSLLNAANLETFQFAKDETTLFFSIGALLGRGPDAPAGSLERIANVINWT